MPSFSTTLEQAIHSALALANEHHHELATLEHLLLALTEEPDAVKVMRACNVDLDELRRMLVEFIEDDLSTLITDVEGSEALDSAISQASAVSIRSQGRSISVFGVARQIARCSTGWWVGPSSPRPMLSWVMT